jgi:hypothetical protein
MRTILVAVSLMALRWFATDNAMTNLGLGFALFLWFVGGAFCIIQDIKEIIK